jgi:hypothetical protein
MATASDVEELVLKVCRDEGAQLVVDRLLELMVPSVALNWLEGWNADLGGAQPKVVLELEGSQPVLDALQAFEQGAFA